MWPSFYIWGFILCCLMSSTRSTNCSYSKFIPYKCQLMSQSNKNLNLPCTVMTNCKAFKEQVPPKGLQLNTVRLVSMNIYHITYSYKDKNYFNETFPALNYTFFLPNCDMFKSCLAIRVNIWNNCTTNSNYGKNGGICRLFDFSRRAQSKKNLQPVHINHNCFTAITASNYYLKFTTLPFTTEIIYSITIKYTVFLKDSKYSDGNTILAVAPMHHQLAISVIIDIRVNNTCKKQLHLINVNTKTENIKSLKNNSFLFENQQPGSFKVRVESDCLQTGQNIESEIIFLKDISALESSESFDATILIWIFVPFILFIILIICLYQYFKRKKKCIDRRHKCVIDMLYDGNIKPDTIVGHHLIMLMEKEFEWLVNHIPVDSFMTCSCELATNDVVLYLTAPDIYGRVKIPQHFKSLHVAKALLYYKPKHIKQIWVDFKQSFDIIKDIKELFYFVYRTTKKNSLAELFDETHYPSVNYIEKLKSWKRFVDLIEDIFTEYYHNHEHL